MPHPVDTVKNSTASLQAIKTLYGFNHCLHALHKVTGTRV